MKARVERLEKLQEKIDELQKEFEAKLAELRAQYDKKYAPLFKSRHDVVAEGIPDFLAARTPEQHDDRRGDPRARHPDSPPP